MERTGMQRRRPAQALRLLLYSAQRELPLPAFSIPKTSLRLTLDGHETRVAPRQLVLLPFELAEAGESRFQRRETGESLRLLSSG